MKAKKVNKQLVKQNRAKKPVAKEDVELPGDGPTTGHRRAKGYGNTLS